MYVLDVYETPVDRDVPLPRIQAADDYKHIVFSSELGIQWWWVCAGCAVKCVVLFLNRCCFSCRVTAAAMPDHHHTVSVFPLHIYNFLH
jgi:hypothetical protein